MMTTTHMLFGTAVIPKRGGWGLLGAALLGAFFPDIYTYALFVWGKVSGTPDSIVWGQWYFSKEMKVWDHVINSFFVYGVLLLIGWRMGWRWLMVFAGAALIHLAFDFPVHREDAHAHFMPLTDWLFVSPVSYYQTEFYARWVIVADIALSILVIIYLAYKHQFRLLFPLATYILLVVCVYIGLTFVFGGEEDHDHQHETYRIQQPEIFTKSRSVAT